MHICIIYLKFCYNIGAKLLIKKRLQNIHKKLDLFLRDTCIVTRVD